MREIKEQTVVGRANYPKDFSEERVGLFVPFTKQESQTRVPSFRVKSTRRVGSISAPHFPQRSSLRLLRSSFVSAIDSPGCHRFYSSIKRITGD
jgi:hypothetical protein